MKDKITLNKHCMNITGIIFAHIFEGKRGCILDLHYSSFEIVLIHFFVTKNVPFPSYQTKCIIGDVVEMTL